MREVLVGFEASRRHTPEERADCAIGFLASRKGVAERPLVDAALALCREYDHRGAPGHGAGLLLDIPWSLVLERFPGHERAVAQRDVALGMFFLPYEAAQRRYCIERAEDLAALAGADVLGWADVPFDVEALPPGSAARRTAPVVRQALVRRPRGMGEDGWFACRYLLRLALDEVLGEEVGDAFKLCSLSNRTVVYKGLAALSKIAVLYPDLRNEEVASRFVLFHSRYSTNTTAVWRRAQPFWSLAHNGEIATIKGNVAWMDAIGRDLLRGLCARHPSLAPLAAVVRSVIAAGGSDSANLDDMLLALFAGGMSLAQSLVALLPAAASAGGAGSVLRPFHDAMGVFLGACDGPAAVVACDGDDAVAHLDRNALRPLWIETTPDYVVAASELTGTLDLGPVERRVLLGPADTVVVSLKSGTVQWTEDVHAAVARQPFPLPAARIEGGEAAPPLAPAGDALLALQRAFGMTREDRDVVVLPLAAAGKLPVGAMGDDTPPAALLDRLPRRPEDYFKLRFAQETSPPIDPIRDAWVFETDVALGDRSGLWNEGAGPHVRFAHRVLSRAQTAWIAAQPQTAPIDLTFDPACGAAGIAAGLDAALERALAAAAAGLAPAAPLRLPGEPGPAQAGTILLLSDRAAGPRRAPLPAVRLVGRLHARLVREGLRHRVGVVVDAGAWDVHHVALLVALGADAVCPWLGCATAGAGEDRYLDGLRAGFVEAMSMMGVTPSTAYCGARLVEAIGLSRALGSAEFAGVPLHLGGIGADVLDAEWFSFHRAACEATLAGAGAAVVGVAAGGAAAARAAVAADLPDTGEFRQKQGGRPHANDAAVVRTIHAAAGYSRRGERLVPGDAAYDAYAHAVADREPVTLLDLLAVRPGDPVALDDVEGEEFILWRFMVAGMSEGALSEPAHRALARAMNVIRRFCLARFRRGGFAPPPGVGPVANSGEGGFDKSRMGRLDGNRSVQYAGGRFTITPMAAALADEAEIKFAQGAKPGKGGQLPGRKVCARIAAQRGCSPGFELVSPPVNHNLYSIEDVKLMLESWRHLNPRVLCALKYVATAGVELVALGGVNAGATRLHLSDGCGGTGAAKRSDQKHAGVPVAAVLPKVHDLLVEEGLREGVEISVDGGVQTGEHALKLFLLGADRIAFGTTLLMTLGCSMLRQCHLAGPHPDDPTGRRRIGCTPGVATQDPALVARFSGQARNVYLFLRAVAREVRARMAAAGIRRLADVVGRRDLLERRTDLSGKAARLDIAHLHGAPPRSAVRRDIDAAASSHRPRARVHEIEAARRALAGETVDLAQKLTNSDRSVGVAAAGEIARRRGDRGLAGSGATLRFRHHGVAGHFYAAYAVDGMEFALRGLCADSCFTAAYGGRLAIVPEREDETLAVCGNTFAYGARGGRAYIAGRAGNRFGICLRRGHDGDAPRIVVQGVLANAFQSMTGGTAMVLGPTGFNLGAGLTGGAVYLLDHDPGCLDARYVTAHALAEEDIEEVRALLREHYMATESRLASRLLAAFAPERFVRVATRLAPEPVE